MSLQSSLEGRPFQGLLNCLNKRMFGNESQYTTEFIIEQLYGGVEMDKADIEAEIESFEQLLLRLSQENWDVSKLERLIKKTQLSVENQRIVILFWTNEREKIHDGVVKRSKWNNSLSHLSWRVDMKTASKTVTEINEPVAFFEFGTESGVPSAATSSQAIRFEMNRTEVADLIATLDGVQRRIDELSY